MPRFARFLFLITLSITLGIPNRAHSQTPDPDPNKGAAAQTRLVVFESFLRST